MQANRHPGLAIESWAPRLYSPAVADFTKKVVSSCKGISYSRAKALIFAVAKLAAFAESRGLALTTEVVLQTSVINRYLSSDPKNFNPATLRTIATNLRSVRLNLTQESPPDSIRFERERAKAPYTVNEIDAFLTLAQHQPTVSRRHRANALISLGVGAGLSGADLRYVRGSDISHVSGGLVVHVGGSHPRVVPVLRKFHELLDFAADYAGEAYIVGGVDRARKNITSGLVASLAGGIDLPPLDLRRMRSTWLIFVAEVIGLQAFMAAAGVNCSQRLGDIVSFLPPVGEEDSVRLLSGRRC